MLNSCPLKIIQMVSSLNVGGMEHFVLRVTKSLQELGHNVCIIALRGGALEKEAQKLGLKVYILKGSGRTLRVVHCLKLFALMRPHIVNVHNPSSIHYAVLSKIVSNARIVMTLHGEGLGNGRKPSEKQWGKIDALIAVSESAGSQVRSDNFKGIAKVIHNGIDILPAKRKASDVRSELGLVNRPVGIIVARIDNLKGHDTLIKSIAILRDQQVPMTLLIVGDGSERVAIEELALKHNLGSDWVRFLGFRSDVPDLLEASDFFVLPSLTEGLPLSVMEAMTHHLPIVATPVGGVPELLDDFHQGILVPVGDVGKLAVAMKTLVENENLRVTMGESAYGRITKEFSFLEMTEKYQDLYLSLN
jgi:L-malate glycosyltransferase